MIKIPYLFAVLLFVKVPLFCSDSSRLLEQEAFAKFGTFSQFVCSNHVEQLPSGKKIFITSTAESVFFNMGNFICRVGAADQATCSTYEKVESSYDENSVETRREATSILNRAQINIKTEPYRQFGSNPSPSHKNIGEFKDARALVTTIKNTAYSDRRLTQGNPRVLNVYNLTISSIYNDRGLLLAHCDGQVIINQTLYNDFILKFVSTPGINESLNIFNFKHYVSRQS
jgi:hypothetical protein